MLRYIFSLSVIIMMAFSQGNATVVEAVPGKLAETLAGLPDIDTELIVTGSINAADFEAFENLKISRLDLSQVRIAELTATRAATKGLKYSAADELPQYCFFASGCNEIILPSSLSAICDGAFANSGITRIEIPDGVVSIGSFAFYNCDRLTNITIPSSVGYIGREAFGRCDGLKSADLATSRVKILSERMFADCPALSSFSLPSSVSEIQQEALTGSAIGSIDLSAVSRIGDFAMAGSPNLKTVTLNPAGEFGAGILMNCPSLTEINGMPADVPDLFAANCGSINPSSYVEAIESVGKYSFANSDLTTLILSKGLEFIDRGAFANSSGLSLIEALGLKSNCPYVDADAFIGLDTSRIRLHVDSSHEQAWLTHPVWSMFDIFSDTYNDIMTPTADAAIRISVENGTLRVAAPDIINSVELFSIDGIRLANITPRQNEISESLTDLNADGGIIVVRVSTDSNSRTAKIIL